MSDAPDPPETTDAKQAHRWAPGQSGNPRGRPRGARHAALAALDTIGAENAQEVMQTVVRAALGGDLKAADLLLRRLWPERKGRPVTLDLPPVEQAADLPRALGAVAAAVAGGEISPEEGQAVASVLELHRRAIETADLADRVAALEAANGHG